MKKNIVISLEHRFYCVNGRVYTALAFDYSYWQDYLSVFDTVKVFARVKSTNLILPNFKLADGDKVDFVNSTYYVGFLNFIFVFPFVLIRAFQLVLKEKNFLLRSGNVSNVLWIALVILGRQYLREFPGDIKAGISHFLGEKKSKSLSVRALANISHKIAAFQASHAVACSYVSNSVRLLYPCGNANKEYVFSSVKLPSLKFEKKNYELLKGSLRVITVGRIENEKGHRYLVEAISILIKEGFIDRSVLTVIGDGTQMNEIKRIAVNLGVELNALGLVTDTKKLYSEFASNDIFVLPSLTEGMPRVLIESMALGMPCLSTRVGGVPEIMSNDDMVDPGSPVALADGIKKIIFMTSSERQCFARDYQSNITNQFSLDKMRLKKQKFWSSLSV